MAFKVGDVVQLKSGGARMTVSKLFKSPEGCEMAAFVIDSLEAAEEASLRTRQGEHARPIWRAGARASVFWVARQRFQPRSPLHRIGVAEGMR